MEWCLEQGFWKWSISTQEITYNTSIDPEFGYQYAFTKPSDYIRTYAIASDGNFDNPITGYADEAGYWYTDCDTIYVQYVSNDSDYGYNYSAWPQTFTEFVEHKLAAKVCIRLSQNASKKAEIDKALEKMKVDARSKDAMNNPVKFMHRGSWSSARLGGRWLGFHAVLPST